MYFMIKSLEKIKKVLSDVEINEEQKLALDEFLAELTESIREKISNEYEEQIAQLESVAQEKGEEWVRIEEAESAYELAMQDAEEAFNLAMKDSERAFSLVQEDLEQEYTEGMTKAMESLYESLYEKAHADVMASPQFESLNKIKEILAPTILQEAQENTLVKRVKELESQLESISKEKEQIERDSIIESLVSELPKKEQKIVRSYIDEAKTIEELYERYNLVISILEAKEETDEDTKGTVSEDFTETEEESEDSIFEETNVDEPAPTDEVSKKRKAKYTSIDEAIIDKVFKV
jgi:hypothetical protein